MRDVIHAIYEAALDEEAFAALPAELSKAAEGRSASLQHFSGAGELIDFGISYFTDDVGAYYLEHRLFEHDVWAPPSLLPQNRDRMHNVEDWVSVETFKRGMIYNDLYRRFGDDTGRCIGAAIGLADGFATIGIHNPVSRPFEADDPARLQPLIPHLRRLFDLRAKLGQTERRLLAAQTLLDTRAEALFLIGQGLRLVTMNAAAERMARHKGPIALKGGQLVCVDPQRDAVLQRLILTALRRRGSQGGSLAVRQDPASMLRISVTPATIAGASHALVTVNRADGLPEQLPTKLAEVYGLSASEAEVVALLAHGRTPEAISQNRRVSLATVRSQVQSAIRKTGASGTTELVRLAATLP